MNKKNFDLFVKEEVKMLIEDYNGWSNWDTWNAHKWISDDEIVSKKAQKTKKPADLLKLFINLFGKNWDNINLKKVDWNELFDVVHE